MDVKKAVNIIGGQSVVADACDVSQQAVSLWVKQNEVPIEHVKLLVSLAREKGVQVDGKYLIPYKIAEIEDAIDHEQYF